MFRGSFSGGGGGGGSSSSSGNLVVVGSIAAADSPHSLQTTTECLLVDTTAGAVTVNMPSPATCGGRIFYIKNTGGGATNNVTLSISSGSIDGASSLTMNNDFAAVTLVSDGANYFILA